MLKGFVDIVTRGRIAGWALESDTPEDALPVAVFANGIEIARATADKPRPDLEPVYGYANHGFDFRLEPRLSSAETYRISVREVSNNKILHETYLTGVCPIWRTAGEIQPIIVLSTGRCGTTILMNKILSIPGVVVAGGYPYEIKLLTYYAHAARVLCTSLREEHWKDPSTIHVDPNIIGPNPFFSHQFSNVFRDPNCLYDFFGGVASDKIQKCFRDIIREFYNSNATDKGMKDARFFAEKSDVLAGNREYLKLLFNKPKEILLVRDLRDAYCSSKSFWSVGADFIVTLAEAKREFIRAYKERDQDLLLVRYEDLITRQNDAIETIGAFLDIEISPNDSLNGDLAFFEKHGTSSTPIDSIGRWRRDLTEVETSRFSHEFSDFFEMFGYEQ
jgi:Sulfotransferase family